VAPSPEKGYKSNLRGQFATLGANVSAFIHILTSNFFLAFISNLGPNNKPKMLKGGPQVFSALTSSVKWA
jgi:hypothetical protein